MEEAKNERGRKELPPYDLTTVHGRDKEGNGKLTFVLEKDSPFTQHEMDTLQKEIQDTLKRFKQD
ncbi:hypothetical protein N9948_00540 [bacterium]|nr:hypothetical protein [bacterium]